jgi:hypothetical protein
MPDPTTAAFVLKPAIIAGLVIGLYESITLMKDVQVPQHKFGHAFHSLIFALVATFASFNVDWVIGIIPGLSTIPVLSSAIAIRVAIGLIVAIKVHSISRATKAGAGLPGLSETWFHTFFLGALVAAAPYLWVLIAPALPLWLK